VLKKIAVLSLAGGTALGMLGTTSVPASAEEGARRVTISGTVYIMDYENFGPNERCHAIVTDNDVVFTSQQNVIDQGWSCGGEVLTELHGIVDLLSGNAIRYHGEVIMREGTCGCQSDTIRARKGFDQVVMPDTTSRVATGRIEWSGGDATDITLQVQNTTP
jgi:hypothetical protein